MSMGGGGMMDAKVDGTPFSVLMQQAVKLKTHVHKVDRVKFDRWPKFYQNSAFVKDEQRKERELPFAERMEVARRYKALADEHFRGDVTQATLNYEWCAGLFKWATPLDANWRKKSLDDDDIEEEEFLGDDEDERRRIAELRVRCYQNLARCYFKQKDWITARHCCDWALAVDPESVAALYLRATVLAEPAAAGASERDAAIADLEKAEALLDDADENAPDFERRRRDVARLLQELKRLRQLGRVADKAYGGMFDRGEVYEKDESQRRRQADAAAEKLAAPSEDDFGKPHAPGDGRFSAKPGPEAELAACLALADEYDATGRGEEAAKLREGVAEARAKIDAARKDGPPPMDFSNPTEAMVRDAEARGIDLADPRVVQLLEELQDERRDAETPQGRARRDRRERAAAAAEKMSMAQLLAALDEANVPHDHCDTKQELADLFALAAADPRAACASVSGRPAAAPEPMHWGTTWACAALFVAYRLWASGILGRLLGGPPAPDVPENPYADAGAAAEEDPWGADEF